MNPVQTAVVIILLAALATAAPPPPVLDTHGDALHFGVQYHILPAAAGHGGLTLGGNTNHSEATCQLGVFQDRNPSSSPGLPVIFSPASGDVRGPAAIPIATDVKIEFFASSTCAQSTVWKLGRFDQDVKKWFVLTGGAKTTPGRRSPSQSLFKIVKVVVQKQHNHHHRRQVLFKIIFCPSVCEECHGLCKDVGIFVDLKTGNRRLALVDHGAFLIQFKKA